MLDHVCLEVAGAARGSLRAIFGAFLPGDEERERAHFVEEARRATESARARAAGLPSFTTGVSSDHPCGPGGVERPAIAGTEEPGTPVLLLDGNAACEGAATETVRREAGGACTRVAAPPGCRDLAVVAAVGVAGLKFRVLPLEPLRDPRRLAALSRVVTRAAPLVPGGGGQPPAVSAAHRIGPGDGPFLAQVEAGPGPPRGPLQALVLVQRGKATVLGHVCGTPLPSAFELGTRRYLLFWHSPCSDEAPGAVLLEVHLLDRDGPRLLLRSSEFSG